MSHKLIHHCISSSKKTKLIMFGIIFIWRCDMTYFVYYCVPSCISMFNLASVWRFAICFLSTKATPSMENQSHSGNTLTAAFAIVKCHSNMIVHHCITLGTAATNVQQSRILISHNTESFPFFFVIILKYFFFKNSISCFWSVKCTDLD